jgi:putative ABC transport system permease protein
MPGYFQAAGTRLLAGRTFTWDDNAPDRRLIVIDEKMARRAFPGENPLGRKLKLALGNGEREWLEVIGVVAHVRQEQLSAESREQIYILPAVFPLWDAPTAVRSTMPPEALMDVVRAEVHALDPDLPVYRVRPMTDYVADVIARDRFAVIMMGLFAGLAVLLTAVGLYGVIAQMVGQRSHEIGIRMALGAGRREILSMVVGRGMFLAAIGIAIGVAGALAGTRLLTSLLHGVAPSDPATYAMVCGLVAGVALLATLVPARRAMRVEPNTALRYE